MLAQASGLDLEPELPFARFVMPMPVHERATSKRTGVPSPGRPREAAICTSRFVSNTTRRVIGASDHDTSSCAASSLPSSDQQSERDSMLSGRVKTRLRNRVAAEGRKSTSTTSPAHAG